MKRAKKIVIISAAVAIIGAFSLALISSGQAGKSPGDMVDNLDGVNVYDNGSVSNSVGRNTTPDGYNLGLKYQCVEFVKRYYYEHYKHKMPDSWGHAVSFFDPKVGDGKVNARRNLTQYKNGGATKPQKGDLVVFGATVLNSYGHVAIVAEATDKYISIIQQNPGPGTPSREKFDIEQKEGEWRVDNGRILGWLRKE